MESGFFNSYGFTDLYRHRFGFASWAPIATTSEMSDKARKPTSIKTIHRCGHDIPVATFTPPFKPTKISFSHKCVRWNCSWSDSNRQPANLEFAALTIGATRASFVVPPSELDCCFYSVTVSTPDFAFLNFPF